MYRVPEYETRSARDPARLVEDSRTPKQDLAAWSALRGLLGLEMR
jgi:hypothetical protein